MKDRSHLWYRLPFLLVAAYILGSTLGLSLFDQRHIFPLDRFAMFGFRSNLEELFFVEVRDKDGRLLCTSPLCDGLTLSSVDKSNLHSTVQGLGRAVENNQEVEIWKERLESKFSKHFPLNLRLIQSEWDWVERKRIEGDQKGGALYEFSIPQ